MGKLVLASLSSQYRDDYVDRHQRDREGGACAPSPFDLFLAFRMSGGGRFVRLGRVTVGFVGVLRGGGVIALVVMLGRGAVRLALS